MDRRTFLKTTGLASLALWTPVAGAGQALAAGRGPKAPILILVELKGGNDGLNTVIPYQDKTYRAARPSLGIDRNQVLQLSNAAGLNPAMKPLMDLWKNKEMAIVQGVGYPSPNRSHFRSIEIWETASDSDETLSEGWLAQALDGHVPKDHAAGGIVIGKDEAGPLSGDMRTLVMQDPERFIKMARRVKLPARHKTPNTALSHILGVQRDLVSGADVIEARLSKVRSLNSDFQKNPFARQLLQVARLLVGGVPVAVAVVKVSLGSFDTHANQRGTHDRLLGQLASGLADLRKVLVKAGMWDRVLISTYSEFGRRVAQNASGGTDHGTAAPHFLMGGRVRGGLYGAQPSLTDLNGGDLKHHVDFRRVYASCARHLGVSVGGSFKRLGIVA